MSPFCSILSPVKVEKVWLPACIKLPLIHFMVIVKSPSQHSSVLISFHKLIWKLVLQFQPFGKFSFARESVAEVKFTWSGFFPELVG